MKNLKILIMILVILSSSFAFALDLTIDGESFPYTGPDVTLVLDDTVFTPKEDQMPPIIVDDRTLVPVREVFELLGGNVSWDATSRTVSITLDDIEVKLIIDNLTATVNGEEVKLDVPAKIINDKTMVPVRFVSEKCGLNVEWDGFTNTVSISSNVFPVLPTLANLEDINFSFSEDSAKLFNNRFESHLGENKNYDDAWNILVSYATIGNNNSNNPLSITLIDENKNKSSVSKLSDVTEMIALISSKQEMKYNISGEYDDTGKLSKIIIKIIP